MNPIKAKYRITRDSGRAPLLALVTRLCSLPGVTEASVSGKEVTLKTNDTHPKSIPGIVKIKTRGHIELELLSAE